MGAKLDLTGKRFKSLLVTSFSGVVKVQGRPSKRVWNCICDCGEECKLPTGSISGRKFEGCPMCEINGIKEEFVGKVFDSKSCGKFTVVKYTSANEVYVRFVETGYESKSAMKEVRKGAITDPLAPSVSSVGFVGVGRHKVLEQSGKKRNTAAYEVWSGILKRCYNTKWQMEQTTGNYDDCTVHEDWHNFQNFAEWYYSQEHWKDNFAVDKDLRVMGNREYGSDTCSLVPPEVNSLFTGSNERLVDRGLPKGIHLCDSKKLYIAQIHCGELTKNGNKKQTYLGQYVNKLDALRAYKLAKERHVKEVANKFKDVLHVEVYKNLMNFEVDITD